MKILSLLALLCAFLAFSNSAAFPEAKNETGSDETLPEPVNDPDAEHLAPEEHAFEPLDEQSYQKALNNTLRRSGSCSSGWTTIKGRCYRIFSLPTTWFSAQSNCRSVQAHLASIHDVEVNYNLLQMIGRAGHVHWIGGNDFRREGRWLWVDGTSFNYHGWCRGEPNNLWLNQHCLQINYSRKRCWDDVNCNHHKPFICVRHY